MDGKLEQQNESIFIRSDGWVFTKDGVERLKAGGYKGFARYKESMESKLGKWHRVSKPLDKDAAEVVKSVKGIVERGVFISSAIVKEAERRLMGKVRSVRSKEGMESRTAFMRLTLTEDAFKAVEGMSNAEFREFVSNAVLRKRCK